MEYLRCVAMGFLLESPVQIGRFSHPHLSTRRGALQILINPSAPFDTPSPKADRAASAKAPGLGRTRIRFGNARKKPLQFGVGFCQLWERSVPDNAFWRAGPNRC